jgi:hypothetical protein
MSEEEKKPDMVQQLIVNVVGNIDWKWIYTRALFVVAVGVMLLFTASFESKASKERNTAQDSLIAQTNRRIDVENKNSTLLQKAFWQRGFVDSTNTHYTRVDIKAIKDFLGIK